MSHYYLQGRCISGWDCGSGDEYQLRGVVALEELHTPARKAKDAMNASSLTERSKSEATPAGREVGEEMKVRRREKE